MSDRRPVLFAYDGSEFAAEAVRQASAMLTPGTAIVLTVWQGIESIAFGPVGMNRSMVEEADSGIADGARRTAEEGAAICRGAGFDVDVLVEPERTAVWSTIKDVAAKHDVSLIVLGSHGRTGIDYVLKGSVATAVSQHAKRPVMIVPSGKVDDPGR